MAEEILEIYNCFNQKIGEETKVDVHKKGYWHRSICFLVVDPGTRETVFQDSKGLEQFHDEDFFVKLNGGHISKGETPEEGFRELREELGLELTASDSTPAGKYQLSFQPTEEFINNEFIYFYIVPLKDAFNKISFTDGEVICITKFNVDETIKLLLGDIEEIKGKARDEKETINITLRKQNFRDFTDDNLYLRMMLAVRRYLDGEDKRTVLI